MTSGQWGPNGEGPDSMPAQRAPAPAPAYQLGRPVIDLTASEQAWLSTDPTALRSLADWHHMQDLSSGVGDGGTRRHQLKAAAEHFDRLLARESAAIMKDFTK